MRQACCTAQGEREGDPTRGSDREREPEGRERVLLLRFVGPVASCLLTTYWLTHDRHFLNLFSLTTEGTKNNNKKQPPNQPYQPATRNRDGSSSSSCCNSSNSNSSSSGRRRRRTFKNSPISWCDRQAHHVNTTIERVARERESQESLTREREFQEREREFQE